MIFICCLCVHAPSPRTGQLISYLLLTRPVMVMREWVCRTAVPALQAVMKIVGTTDDSTI